MQRLTIANAIVIAAAVVVLGVLSVIRLSFPEVTASDLRQGRWQVRMEKELDDAFPLREFALNVWTAVRLVGFGDAQPGALVGADGWLFSLEEMATRDDEAESIASNARFVGRALSALRARGQPAVVVIVPAKARLHADSLGRHRFNAAPRYAALVDLIAATDTVVIDLTDAFADDSQPGWPFYWRTDTHWTPAGAKLAAQSVARALLAEELSSEAAAGRTFETRIAPAQPFDGDLAGFLPLRPYLGALAPARELLSRPVTEPREPAAESLLFGDTSVECVLIGTSYSADARWNFAGYLREHLDRDVVNLARKGEGPFLPMLDFLNTRDTAPTVVWEIPERYLALPADARLQAFINSP